jgi:hypothetical protein
MSKNYCHHINEFIFRFLALHVFDLGYTHENSEKSDTKKRHGKVSQKTILRFGM